MADVPPSGIRLHLHSGVRGKVKCSSRLVEIERQLPRLCVEVVLEFHDSQRGFLR